MEWRQQTRVSCADAFNEAQRWIEVHDPPPSSIYFTSREVQANYLCTSLLILAQRNFSVHLSLPCEKCFIFSHCLLKTCTVLLF